MATRPSWVVGFRLLSMGAGPRGSQAEKEKEGQGSYSRGQGTGALQQLCQAGVWGINLPTEGGVTVASGPNWGVGPQATLVGTGFSGHQAGEREVRPYGKGVGQGCCWDEPDREALHLSGKVLC